MREHVMATLGGVLAGVLGVTVLEVLSSYLYPPPPGFDFSDKESLARFMAEQPWGAVSLVFAAHGVGSFLGGAVVALFSRRKAYDRALVIGLLLMVAGILTLLSLPQPIWIALVDVALYVPMALLGCFVAGTFVELNRQP